MTEEQIVELERLAVQATPGPWRVESEVVRDSMGLFWPISSVEGAEDNVTENVTTGDAAYIVAACNAVPELIAENRALQERVRELERMTDIMAEELSSVEIAPSICHGCKEQDMFGMYSCGGKDCIYFMVKQAAKVAGNA